MYCLLTEVPNTYKLQIGVDLLFNVDVDYNDKVQPYCKVKN